MDVMDGWDGQMDGMDGWDGQMDGMGEFTRREKQFSFGRGKTNERTNEVGDAFPFI